MKLLCNRSVCPKAESARRTVRSSLSVVLFLFLAGCTHTIRHVAPPPMSTSSSEELNVVFSPDTVNRTVDKRIGINVDSWRFEIGSALTDVLPRALGSTYGKVSVISNPHALDTARGTTVPSLSIRFVDLDFHAGMTVFSEHAVTLVVHAEFKNSKGTTKFSREFRSEGSSTGSAQGKTWAGLVFAPLGTEGMNSATEVAVTNSIIQLAGDLITAMRQ